MDGVLAVGGKKNPTEDQIRFSRDDNTGGMSLSEVIQAVKPTILLGLTGCGGLFTENIVREMAVNNDRPIIFPLSNPTRNAECTAEEVHAPFHAPTRACPLHCGRGAPTAHQLARQPRPSPVPCRNGAT